MGGGVTAGSRDLFADAGALEAAYGAVDWAATPLGPPGTWSPALRASVDLCLNTRFPVTLLWGPELVLVYNAPYAALIGDKHPDALGRGTADVFPEVWAEIGPMLHGVLEGGEATFLADTLLPLHRDGFLEETYFTYAYSPVHGQDGRVEGVIDICGEDTTRVLTTRRLQLLARLQHALLNPQSIAELSASTQQVLGADRADLPAFEVRLRDSDPVADDRLPRRAEPEQGFSGSVTLEETAEGTVAWLPLDATLADTDECLVVLLSPMLRPDPDYLDFLGLIASALCQSLARLRSLQAEHDLSTALQRSMLTRPVTGADVDVAVRYVPAAVLAQIGGDWYDVFPLPSGDLSLVVGDVAGHDSGAAAIMGQLRNLLRAVAYLGSVSPAGVLDGLQRSITGLALDAVATAIVGELSEVATGSPVFRWSNAGHPPPVLLDADGGTELLERRAEMLLGIEDGVPRIDHVVRLPPGSTLVLYTDGLVERRGEHLDTGLAWLHDTLGGCHDRSAEDICDLLITEAAGRHEDDVALVVVRVPGRRD